MPSLCWVLPRTLFHFTFIPASGSMCTAGPWQHWSVPGSTPLPACVVCPHSACVISPPLLGVTAPQGHVTWTWSGNSLSAVCALRWASGAKYQSFNNWCVENDSCLFSFYRKIEFSVASYENVGKEQPLSHLDANFVWHFMYVSSIFDVPK